MGDDADTIYLKFKKAKTDAEALPSEIDGLKDRPEAENLVTIYSALSEQSMDRTLREVGGKQFSEFKPILAERAVELLSPISTENEYDACLRGKLVQNMGSTILHF